MRVAIRQVLGNSGTDVWAESLCCGLRKAGQECKVDFRSLVYQFVPQLAHLISVSSSYDILQGNSWNAFAFKSAHPMVVTEHLMVHDHALDPYKTAAQRAYFRWIYLCEKRSFAAADAIVSVSRYTQKITEKVFGLSDTRMIYNGIDSSFFMPRPASRKAWGIPEDACILLYIGNLSRRKGADLLSGLMKELGEKFLLLITAGNRKKSQNSIPHSRNIGHIDPMHLVDLYNLSDVFVIPSRMEGLSLSTLEAMSCGRPVVAFNCSSFPELIVDGKGGFLCELDNVREYADRIRYLAGDPDAVKRMGEYNRQRVLEQFTIERMTQGYMKIYESLIS